MNSDADGRNPAPAPSASQAEGEFSISASRRFEASFEQAAVGIAHVGIDGRWLRVNRRLSAFLGYTPDELVAKTFQDITHPDDLDADLDQLRRMLAREIETYSMEKRYFRKNGSLVWAKLTVSLVWNDDGTPDCFVSIVEDISARKSAEAARAESESRLQLLIDHAPAALAMFDREMRYLAVSGRWRADYGLGEVSLIGRSHYEIFPEIPAEWRAVHARGMAGEIVAKNEDCFERSDGRVQWLRWEVRPWKAADGGIGGIVIFSEDITERQSAAAELQRYSEHLEELVAERTRQLELAKRAAEAANVAKSAFLANMSHEIRTPLNAIGGMVFLLQRSGVNREQADRLAKIEGASRHLLETINAILELSKIEAGRLEIHETDVHVRRLVAEIDSMFHERFSVRGLEFDTQVQTPALNLVGDATRLRQMLVNYVGNAIKFTQSGRVTLRVAVDDEDEDSVLLRFEVEDTGIGIDPMALPRLFNAFEQAERGTANRFGGTGLGLAINRKLAEAMGGEVGARSIPGSGSCFWFTARLARARAESRSEADAVPVPEETLLRERHRGKRILLAEDDPISRDVAAELLRSTGLIVALAEDGAQAVERAASAGFDLVLMDMRMPELDGAEATRRIHALPGKSKLKVVAMTANAFAEDRERCTAAGMIDFIAKPVDPPLMFATLLRVLDAG